MFRISGRAVNSREFTRILQEKTVNAMMDKLLSSIRDHASSIVDPVTGSHALVLAWRGEGTRVSVRSAGSSAFSTILERKLAREKLLTNKSNNQPSIPFVYLAHASEDKAFAKQLATKLMDAGIQVWFDGWEIVAGDSLRRKMEDGIGSCTHFVVILSPSSVAKPWVNEEIDAGFVKKVQGNAKFIPLRYGLPLESLTSLMSAIHSPEISLEDESAVLQLVSQIHGISDKPSLGLKPRYVKQIDDLEGFSPAAIEVARVLVTSSKNAGDLDPEIGLDELASQTGLSLDDCEIAVLDLYESGLLRRTDIVGYDEVWPLGPLFVLFDAHFMGWSPTKDAVEIAVRMVDGKIEEWSAQELQAQTGWSVRRLNAAFAAIEALDIAEVERFSDGSSYMASSLIVTAKTKRAARTG